MAAGSLLQLVYLCVCYVVANLSMVAKEAPSSDEVEVIRMYCELCWYNMIHANSIHMCSKSHGHYVIIETPGVHHVRTCIWGSCHPSIIVNTTSTCSSVLRFSFLHVLRYQ